MRSHQHGSTFIVSCNHETCLLRKSSELRSLDFMALVEVSQHSLFEYDVPVEATA